MSDIAKPELTKSPDAEPLDLAGEMRSFAMNMRRDDSDARESIRAPYADVLEDFASSVGQLEAAARLARSALDGLMGDSDLADDGSAEMKAMQALNKVLD